MDNNGLNLLWWTCATGIAGWVFKEFIISPLQKSIERLVMVIDKMSERQTNLDKLLARHDEQIHTLDKRLSVLENEK